MIGFSASCGSGFRALGPWVAQLTGPSVTKAWLCGTNAAWHRMTRASVQEVVGNMNVMAVGGQKDPLSLV